jgi:sugar lactone lactonase YvrE
MCAFGGNNLDTLFVTSLRRAGISEEEDPYAGRVFALQPSVKGLAEPMFKNTPIA